MDYLVDKSIYLFWVNISLIIVFLILNFRDLITTFRSRKKENVTIKIFLLRLSFIYPIVLLITDLISSGFISQYLDKKVFIYFSFGLYLLLIILLIISLRKSNRSKPFYDSFINGKITFGTFIIFYSTLVVYYPFFLDLQMQSNPDINFKIISNNGVNFMNSKGSDSLKVSYDLMVSNFSNESYDVIVTTKYSPINDQVFTSIYKTEELFAKMDFECTYEYTARNFVSPNGTSVITILNTSTFLPNLIDSPINMILSDIILDDITYSNCGIPRSSLIMPISHNGFDLGNYGIAAESPKWEFSFYWKSQVHLSKGYNNKYNFYFYGFISHQPNFYTNNQTTFLATGNFVEGVGMHNSYLLYGKTKTFDDNISSCVFNKDINNELNKYFKSEFGLYGHTLGNNKIVFNNTTDYTFYEFNTVLPNPLSEPFYRKQSEIFSKDTSVAITEMKRVAGK